MNLPEQIEQTVHDRSLFRRRERILVAVSGGVDSMVLLHLLNQLAPHNRWQLTVAHFNHQLRGQSSNADERLVMKTAKALGLPFMRSGCNVRAFAKANKLSIEMAARQLRHEFLARTANKLGIKMVALAHHADDQVELFFLRLLRGSGSDGLAGMKWSSLSPADYDIKLVRPLLGTSKSTLEQFARDRRIAFREDASNGLLDLQRNRIRHELLPLLRRDYQPALKRTILRVMDILAAEAEFVGAAARVVKKSRGKMKFPVALERRILQEKLLKQGITPEFELIERLRHASERDLRAVLSGGKRKTDRPAKTFSRGKRTLNVTKAGSLTFSEALFSWHQERQASFGRPKSVAGREVFDLQKVGPLVTLRHWRAGDRFQPIGMNATVKLQDLFVNAKISQAKRHELVVATTADDEIFWVEGLRISERFKLTAQTRRRLVWNWRRE